MKRSCEYCGESIDHRHAVARYCGNRCRQRGYRRQKKKQHLAEQLNPGQTLQDVNDRVLRIVAGDDNPHDTPSTPVENTTGEVQRPKPEAKTWQAVYDWLYVRQQLDHVMGQAALALALKIDSPMESAGGVANAVNRLGKTLEEIETSSRPVDDPLAEARRKREAKRRASS